MNPALNFPADDFDTPDEPWFCEARDKDPRDEHDRQARFVAFMRKNAPSALVAAFGNGGKLTEWQKVRRWKEGVLAGMNDLVVIWNRGAFFAEFKDGREMPRRDQRDVLNQLYRMGWRCGVYRRPETLIGHLREAGCPFL